VNVCPYSYYYEMPRRTCVGFALQHTGSKRGGGGEGGGDVATS